MPINPSFFPPLLIILTVMLTACDGRKEQVPATRSFPVRGVIREIKPGATAAVIAHEEITNYMAAMTMPFRVRDTNELGHLAPGDIVSFRLQVTENESWIESVTKTGETNAPSPKAGSAAPAAPSNTNAPPRLVDFIGDINFTNEFGRTVKWSEFEGQAVGFLFFFTRCPLPEYCPRLSKNLAGAQEKLKGMTNAPANWRLVSITIEPEFDTPAVMRSYGKSYGADSNRWSFLTAAPADIAKFGRLFGLSYEREGGTINHDFRTVVVDTAGHVQAAWPIGGDTTDMLVTEILKAAGRRKE